MPVFSKILEKAVFLQIVDYLNANQLYHPNHHGFRYNHNTVTGIIQMYDIWTDSLEKKQMAGVMMVDLLAAFDMVDHSLLFRKIENHGVWFGVLQFLS